MTVDARVVGSIGRGILALIGVQRGDDATHGERLLERVLTYRIFEDDAGRMNLCLARHRRRAAAGAAVHAGGGYPQGHAAGIQHRGDPRAGARRCSRQLVALARTRHAEVATGQFGAHMRVALVNDGPVTFWLEAPG